MARPGTYTSSKSGNTFIRYTKEAPPRLQIHPQNAVFRLKTPISPPQHNHSQFATIRPGLTEPAQIPQPTYSQNAVNPQLCKKIRFDLTEPIYWILSG